MHYFSYKNGELFCEQIPVNQIVEEFGTPLFVYSSGTLKRHYRIFEETFFKRASCNLFFYESML